MKVLYTEEQIAAAVRRTAVEIRACYGEDAEVTVLVLLNGALWFAADLLRQLPVGFQLQTVRLSSYGAARQSNGCPQWLTALPELRGRRVLVLDDVADSGLTLRDVCAAVQDAGAMEVRTVVAVDKPGGRRVPFCPDFVALTAGTEFLAGYGMDDAGLYRNLPYIVSL